MEQKFHDEIEIDLKDLFFVLLHKLWIIIIVGFITGAFMGIYNKFFVPPMYTSSTKLYMIYRQYEDMLTWTDLQTGLFLAQDFMIIVKSRPVTEEVINKLELDMTHEQLASMITVNTPPETRVMEIMVTYTEPKMAKQLADTVAMVSSERFVQVMEMERVNILEEGNIPNYPTSPNIIRAILLGGILGVIVSSAIILLIYILNDKIRSTEDIERYIGISALGAIPIEEEVFLRRRKKGRPIGSLPYRSEGDYYG